MHELGNIQGVVNPWAVYNPWDTRETQLTSGSSRFCVYDDAAGAVINPWAVFNPWDTQETQSTLEINTLTQNQIKAEPNKSLQSQENLGSQRVLNLLRDNIAQLINARWTKRGTSCHDL